MTSAELRYMQIVISADQGAKLPGLTLLKRFSMVEFLTHISMDEGTLRCLIRVEYATPRALEDIDGPLEILNILEHGPKAALLEAKATGPLPRIFGALEHVWWVSPTYLDKNGLVLTIRGTKESLRDSRQGLSDLLGESYKMKLGAQSLHNAQFIALLPDRQRLVLDKAIELGYYDRPRRCTQRTIADALDIKQATVSEHLQSAESTIIHAFVDEP